MGTETKLVTVNDIEYRFNTWPASKGMDFGVRLMAIGGEAMGAVAQGISNVKWGTHLTAEGSLALDADGLPEMVITNATENEYIQKATSFLISKLNAKEVIPLIKEILAGVTVQGEGSPINFDQYFAGNYGTMVKLAIQVIKENNLHSFFTESVTGVMSQL